MRGKRGVPRELENPDRCVIDHPNSTLAECVRTIRTNLLFMAPERSLRSMLITSAGPREGKTCTCVNIGATMALSGAKPFDRLGFAQAASPQKFWDKQSTRTDQFVMDSEVPTKDVVLTTEVPNLDVLFSGPLPPNPSEILHTQGFRRTLARLLEEYDRVISIRHRSVR